MCDHCSKQGIENAAGIADTAAAPDEMPKTYDPSSVEERLYKKWEERGYFHSEPNPDKPPYTIVIPPPNITGQLHMGHALDETMQDILIRYSGCPARIMHPLQPKLRLLTNLRPKAFQKRISAERVFLNMLGHGKKNTADA